MNAPNENPLVPPSLPADGIQGAGAATWAQCRVKHTPLPSFMRIRMLFALDGVRTDLAAYASNTDRPEHRLVHVADCIDTAMDLLDGPAVLSDLFGPGEFSDAGKGGGP